MSWRRRPRIIGGDAAGRAAHVRSPVNATFARLATSTAQPPCRMQPRLTAAMLALAAPAALSAIGVWLTHGYSQRDVLVGNDVRELWLPTWTYLGQSLSNGHVPLWDPHVLSG